MSEKIVCEIINPSDPYTIEVPDKITAFACMALLSGGKYGLIDSNGISYIDIHWLDPDDSFIQKEIGMTLEQAGQWFEKPENKIRVAEALDSVVIGNEDARKFFGVETAGMNQDEFMAARKKLNDERRSSLNDIGGAAWAIAENLRKKTGGTEQ